MNNPSKKAILSGQAIALNEARFKAMIAATSDVIYSVSADWVVMQQLDGRGFLPDAHEPTSNWQEINLPAEDRAAINAVINEAIREKKIFQLEHRVNRVDGTIGWTFSRAVPIMDDEGEIIEWFGTASDITDRKLAEEALQVAKDESEREKRVYETIISGTPDLMYVFDLDYRFTYVNSALLKMWGKKEEDAIGKGLLENGYEPWHAEMHEREIDKIKATKKSIRGEVSFPHATLGTRVYDYILIPVLNAQGEVEAVAGTTRDVTERYELELSLKQTLEELQAINEEMNSFNDEIAATNEELLASNEELELLNQKLITAQQKIEESENELRLAINAANFGTWFIHSKTRELVTNPRLKELFGFHADEEMSLEQALGQIIEEYRDFVANKIENAIYNNGDYDVTYPVIGLHDQKLRWLRAIGNLKADPSGAYSKFTGVVMDITEQYLSAKKIEQTEKSLRMAIDAAGLGTYYINATDRIFVASPKLKEFFGFYPDEEVPYDAAINQIHEDYRKQAADLVEAAFVKGTRFDMEYPIVGHNDGKIRWVRGIGEMQHSDGKDFFTGVLHEITERKQDEIRKNDFIGMVSHELKTPLTSLSAIVQLANSKLKNSDDQFLASAMSKAYVQVNRMTNMINGFLNISRLESGKIMIEKHHFNIDELVREIVDEIKVSATNKFNLDLCEAVIIYADRDKINSVISNLISNAVKYSPNDTAIEVICGVNENDVTFSVKDEGMGIEMEDANKIFDRYYRVKSNNMRYISGFGIGLYLSAEIIERHGGKIWVESEKGKGSTFHFSLPKES